MFFKSKLTLLTALAALLAGCADSAKESEPARRFITVEAAASLPGNEGTRVTIGEYDAAKGAFPMSWSGDEILAITNNSDLYDTASPAPEATITESDGRHATFRVELPDAGGKVYYAIAPSSALESSDGDAAYLQIPVMQTPTNTSADPSAIVMVSQGSQLDNGKLSFSFCHAAAYARIKIKGIDAKSLRSVQFTAHGCEVAGNYGYFYDEGEGAADNGASESITIDASQLTPDSEGVFTVWFSLIPSRLSGNYTITAIDGAGNICTKEFNAATRPITFTAGRVSGFTADLTPEKESPNTYVVIAKSANEYYAMSNKDKSSRLEGVQLNDYNGQTTYQTSNQNIVWTFIDNGDGTYYLENGGKYLTNGDNRATLTNNAVAMDVNFKNGYIQVHSDKSRYLTLNANTGLNYFGFYTSSSSSTLIRSLLIVPVNDNSDGKGDGDDDNGDGDDDTDPALVYRTGWPELPVTNEYVYQTNYRRDRDNDDYYYAHHLCPDVNNAQGNGKARNYTVCFSAKHHVPLWVAAPRHAKYEQGSGRTDAYKADPNIPSNLQYTTKTTGSSCNKGHMLGSAERTVTTATNAQVFYYSNIAPQEANTFNTGGGAWNNIEDWVDKKVCADTTYVVIGAYFDNYTDKLRGYNATAKKISYCGRNDVSWPTMFYYVILRTKKGNTGKSVRDCSQDEIMCAAFARSHNCAKGTAVSRQDMMSVAELEELTGFTYFPNVPNAPKDSFDPSDWGL